MMTPENLSMNTLKGMPLWSDIKGNLEPFLHDSFEPFFDQTFREWVPKKARSEESVIETLTDLKAKPRLQAVYYSARKADCTPLF